MGEGFSLTRKAGADAREFRTAVRSASRPAVVGQVLLGTLPRVRVLLEHIVFSLRCTAWRCTLAASCKRYAKGEFSQGAFGLFRSAGGARTTRSGRRRPRHTRRWPVGWGMCPNGAFHPLAGRRGEELAVRWTTRRLAHCDGEGRESGRAQKWRS